MLVCVCRNELQRELALRRELEEEGERARDEREERARVIARELGEAMRQRDQAAHTAHSLETALKCSQVSHGHVHSQRASLAYATALHNGRRCLCT